jgi:transposase, IS6 family
LAQRKEWEKPRVIHTDKAAAYGMAIQELKVEVKLPNDTEHRQAKYLNNIVEADHGKLKRLIKPTLGFKSMKTAMQPLKALKRCVP